MSKFFDLYEPTFNGIILEECQDESRNRIFSNVINKYHSYMKNKSTCNRRINWLVHETDTGNLIGAMGINSAILSMGVRDNYIGWNKQTKLKHLNSVGNNYRFCLIKKNITQKNVGTKVLKEFRLKSAFRWKEKYGDDLLLIETLVHPDWSGSIYKADNWVELGFTKGFSFSKAPLGLWKKEDSPRGILARENPKAAIKKYAVGGKHYSFTESIPKRVFIKPLIKEWREFLTKP
jgi:hypothetical protein